MPAPMRGMAKGLLMCCQGVMVTEYCFTLHGTAGSLCCADR